MAKHRQTKSPFKADLPVVEIGLLYPPIPGDHERADGGIGLRHVEVPLVVHIARPNSTPRGTHFQLYWANVLVALNQIRDGDEGLTRIPFTVPLNAVRETWADPVFARVIRPSGNPSETAPLRLRVNLKRPGGQAPEPTQDGNRNLVLVLPPDVEIGGISDDRAKLGVEVILRHWLNMAAYDLIQLVWGSQVIKHWVQPGEVGFDISLTVDYATIVEAGDSELLPVAFQVIGNTGNAPDPRAPWSVPYRVPVYLSSDRLDAPWLEFPNTAPNIDLVELGKQHVRIGLYVSAANARVYERVFLIWAGANEGGSVPHVDNQELPGGRTYYFDVPNDLVQALANGRATVHYSLEGNGIPPKRSHNLYLSIIGAVVQWPAPWIVEQVGGILDPSIAVITVQFPEQATWRPEDLIQVNLLFSDPNNTLEYKASARFDSLANQNGTLSFVLSDANIRRFDGLRMEVFYVLLRNGQESLRESYQVGEPKRDMPAPEIYKAVGGQLDPDDVPITATVLAPFSGTLANDKMTLYWNGPVISTQVAKDVVQNGTQIEFEVAHSFIAANLDQQVFVSYILERGTDTPRYSDITPVLIAHGLLDLPPPDLIQASITGPGTATLAPLDALNGAQLVVQYTGMHKDDEIKVTMAGTPGAGSPDIPSKPGNTVTQEVVFDISREAIAANIGNGDKFVRFTYVVTRNGKPTLSQELTVRVLPIPQDELLKTTIRINEADPQTRILDLAKVTNGATAHIGTWPFITALWPVWLHLHGKKNGLDYPLILFDGSAGFSVNPGWVDAGYFEHPILAAYLNELDHGSELYMVFKAAVSASRVEADAIVFPQVNYSVIKAPALSIDVTPMILSGRAIVAAGWPRNGQDYPGNAQARLATGGLSPLKYSSRNPAVAVVVGTNGKVTGMRNGSTYIDVTDAAGSVVSYEVRVSNVWQLRENRAWMTWHQAVAWRKSLPGAVGIYFADGISFLRTVHGWPLPVQYDSFYWLGVEEGCDFLTGVYWDSLKDSHTVWCINRNTHAWAWCLQP